MDEKQVELIKKTSQLIRNKLDIKEIPKEDKDEAIQMVKDAKDTLIIATDDACCVLGNTCLIISVFGALLQKLYADEDIPNDVIDEVIEKARFFSKLTEEQLQERFIKSVGSIIENYEEEVNEKKEKEEQVQTMIDKLDGLNNE